MCLICCISIPHCKSYVLIIFLFKYISFKYSMLDYIVGAKKKLFEFLIERYFANAKVFNMTQHLFLFQCFFGIEVSFFGIAIQKLRGDAK